MNKKKLKLDLGCGQNCNVADIQLSRENLNCDHRWTFNGFQATCKLCDSTGTKFTGVDFVKCDGVDIVHDLTKFPYPLEDESVDEVFSAHFIEHLDGFERRKFMEEIWRILTPYGKVKFVHPYYKSVRAIQDYSHKFPPIAENSYFYWNRKWITDNKLEHYNIKCDFEVKNIFYIWQDGAWANKAEEARNFAIDKYWNVVADMVVELEKNPADKSIQWDKGVNNQKSNQPKKEKTIKQSIIIPTYNKCNQLLKPCIESIIQFTDLEETEIIVSANGCTDETREYVNGLNHPNIKLLWSNERLGYPKAVNAGIRFARGEYIIPLNNDTILLPQGKNDWINILKKPFLTDETVGLSAPMKTHSPSANRKFLIFFCVMIHRKVISKIGLLDESFGDGYGEDTAFCCEAEDAGFKVVQVPEDSEIYYAEKRMTGNFPIWHEGNVTFKDWKDGDKLLANNNRLLERYDRSKADYQKRLIDEKVSNNDWKASHNFDNTVVKKDNNDKSLFGEIGVERNIELMKRSLIGVLTDEQFIKTMNNELTDEEINVILDDENLKYEQLDGSQKTEDIPANGMTMIGLQRLNNIQECVSNIISGKIEGDLVEAGVWRGGACIFMAHLLKVSAEQHRNVYVCDSFEGLPKPSGVYPQDEYSEFHNSPLLMVSLETVLSNFNKYKLLDDNVKFVKGFFSETMTWGTFHSNKIALLRLDGDMYGSTMDVLVKLYDRVSVGGYIIVDDYALKPCKKAIDDFRNARNISDEIINIDETGVYWVKSKGNNDNDNGEKKSDMDFTGITTVDEDDVDISKALLCDGYMSETELLWLARNVKGKKICLELGSWHGRSARALADNLSEGSVLYCIDTFNGSKDEQSTWHQSAKWMDGDHAFYEFMQNNYDLVASGKIIPLRMSGDNASKLFAEKGIKLDFCFIDAGHTYEEVKSDLIHWIPLMKEGSLLCGHDYYHNGWEWVGVKNAVDSIVPNVKVADNASIWHTKTNSFLQEKLNHINKPKVYDCFPFFNELDILEMRFEELWDVVDRFIIVEATLTHGGMPKPLYFKDNLQRFSKYLSKVSHIVVDDYPALDSWSIERYQRDAIMRGLADCKDNDIIIMGDADEIPRAEVIKNYKIEQGLCCIRQSLYYYNFNCKAKQYWDWLRILPFSKMKTMTPCEVRYTVNYDLEKQVIHNGGWHLSYFADIDGIIEKIKASAHQEYNTPELTDRDSVAKAVTEGKDIFGRNLQYEIVSPLNHPSESEFGLPKSVYGNEDKYKQYFFLPTLKTPTPIIDTLDLDNTLDLDIRGYFFLMQNNGN